MNDEKYYRFSQDEFIVMLLLAGGTGCVVGLSDEKVDSVGLAEALAELFSEGWVKREGDEFVPDGEGRLFYEISAASHTLLLSAPPQFGRTAMCYVCAGHTIWTCELMVDGCRLKKRSMAEFCQWLIASGMLEPPAMRAEDIRELEDLYTEDGQAVDSECLLRLEMYEIGGKLGGEYNVIRAGGVTLIRYVDGNTVNVRFYTQESLNQMLKDAFSCSQEVVGPSPAADGGII